jgi:hypothetical protein
MEHFEIIIPILILLFFIGLWILILKMLAVMSGWTILAERFYYPATFDGRYYRFQSAWLNKVNFRSSLEMGMNIMGLYLIPLILFRLFHKPLFIPWEEITAEPCKRYLIQVYRLRFKSSPAIALDVYKKTFERMLEFNIALKNFPFDEAAD